MPRLNVYMILGLLDGYYTAMVIENLTSSNLVSLMVITALVNAVTGLLSSYVLNTSYLRDIERRLLVKRGYLTNTLLHRSLILRSIMDTIYWVLMSMLGSLIILFIRYVITLVVLNLLQPILYMLPPLVFMYILSRITGTDYQWLMVLTVTLTIMIYLISTMLNT